MSKEYPIPGSFDFAYNGLKTALKNEPNFKVHSIVAFIVLFAALLFQFSPIEWALLIFTIGLVLILELINTAIEAVVDLVSPDLKDHAKIAKDVSAGAVLISAIISLLIGLILFLPKIIVYF